MRRFLLFCSISILVSSCFYDPYIAQYREREASRVHVGEVYNSGTYVSRDIEIWTLPDSKKLDTFIETLRNAKKRIWIEVYILTEKSTIASLIDAKKRGVDVRVVLERNVYNTPFIHETLFRDLREADIEVVWANNDAFTFTHAKFFLVDDTLFLSTGNLSYTTFTKNRDFVFVTREKEDIALFESVFGADFSHAAIYPRSALFLFSPIDARGRILALFDHASQSIMLSIQSLTDRAIMEALMHAVRRGVSVYICTNPQDTSETSGITAYFSGTAVQVGFSEKPYIHAKIALIDTGTLFLGSMNFTANSLDNNREAGVIMNVSSGELIETLRETIARDCHFSGGYP